MDLRSAWLAVAHGVTARPDVRLRGKNFLAGDVELSVLVCDRDSMWPRGLHEPRALDSNSYLADRASLWLHCVMPISPHCRRAAPAFA